MDESNLIEVIVKFNGNIDHIARELDVFLEILYEGYAIITTPPSKIPLLYEYPEIEHIELPKILSFEATRSLVTTCIRPVQSSPRWQLTGRDVIVAIIDSGIDYTHPDFRNEDGTSRILYIWDQTAAGTPPQGFLAGAEYDNAQISEALQSPAPFSIIPQVDTNGHGTAVSGVAVGNGRASNGQNIGAAPEADIIAVKLGTRGYESFARTTELMRAIKYVIFKAEELQKPVAINISFGTTDGSHRGDSLFETYINEISENWKTIIVIPTGNEGSSGHHYEGTIGPFETMDINFFTSTGVDSFYITLWKDFADTFSVELISPSGRTSGLANMDNQVQTARENGMTITIYYGQPSHYSVSQQVFFDVRGLEGSGTPGLWKIRITSENIADGRFEMWLPSIEAVSNKTFFATPSISNTLTIPSTARKVISVAGYNDRTDSIVDFSGMGPSGPQPIQKPDLAAPATEISSTRLGGGYGVFSGTSLAAPFVTGAAALMMQWGIAQGNDPFLYGERIKAFLRLGANRQRTRQYPNMYWGYGTLCLENSMNYLQRYQLGGGVENWPRL
jgi:subtilisin family serine protease